jgi:NitT/TauT family transport system ATP-binding protein
VRRLDLAIEPGELVCVLGPSGCGKSTLLGALAGHLPITEGELTVDGRAIDGPSPDSGMVFQQHSLFPWKTVRDNVAFAPKMRGVGKPRSRFSNWSALRASRHFTRHSCQAECSSASRSLGC